MEARPASRYAICIFFLGVLAIQSQPLGINASPTPNSNRVDVLQKPSQPLIIQNRVKRVIAGGPPHPNGIHAPNSRTFHQGGIPRQHVITHAGNPDEVGAPVAVQPNAPGAARGVLQDRNPALARLLENNQPARPIGPIDRLLLQRLPVDNNNIIGVAATGFEGVGLKSMPYNLRIDSVAEPVKIVESVVKPVKTVESIVKPVKTVESVVKPVKTVESVVKPVKTVEPVAEVSEQITGNNIEAATGTISSVSAAGSGSSSSILASIVTAIF